jgi:hypothetical protein
MADQEARFAVELDVKGQQASDGMADSLARLKAQIQADQAGINELQAAMRRLQQAGSSNTAVFKQLRDQLAAKKASLGAAQESYVKLGGTFGEVKQAAKATSGGLDELLGVAQGAGGPLGELAGAGSRLTGVLGKAGAAGAVVALVAALALVVAGTVAAIASLTHFAIVSADAARSQRLFLEAATGGRVAADALTTAIDAVGGRVATARAQLEEMALGLARSGLAGRALEAAFSAVATASAVMGQAAGSTLQGIADRARQARRFVLGAFDLQGTGLKLVDVAQALATKMKISLGAAVTAIRDGRVRVEDGLEALDAAVQAKFGKLARAQLLGFTFQLQKARENVSRIFAGVNIEPFLEALHDVLSLLDQSTITGRALRAIAETALNPLLETLASLGPIAKGFFQGMVIGALLVAVGVLKLRNAWRDAFGGETRSSIDWVKTAMYAGAGAVGALVAILAALGVVLAVAVGPFVLLAKVAYNAYNALIGINWSSAGSNIVDGLIGGITGGVGRVVAAVKGLGQSAMAALTGTLKIGSPSKVFAEYGSFTAQGFAEGVEDGSARADQAVTAMVARPSKPSTGAQGAARGAQRSSGGNTYVFNIAGVENAEALKEPSFLAKLAAALEGTVQQAGAPLEPELA